MASGQIVANLANWKPLLSSSARGVTIPDGSTPVGYHPAFAFAGVTTQEYLDCSGIIEPVAYAGNGLRLRFWVAANSTSNASVFQAGFRRHNTAEAVNAAHSFSNQTGNTITWAGTAYFPQLVTIDFTNAQIDSLVGEDPFDLRITRDFTVAADTYTGDAYLLWEFAYLLEKP